MRCIVVTAVAALASIAMAAELVNISMDSQINLGSGDAIIAQLNGTVSFPGAEGDNLGTRMNVDVSYGGDYYYGPRVYFTRAGYAPLDITGGATLTADAIFYQDPNRSTGDTASPNYPIYVGTPYLDCNYFVRIYSGTADFPGTFRDFGLLYGPNASVWPFGDWMNWNTLTLDLVNAPHTDAAGFDPTAVTQMRFYGTDWSGGADLDYLQVRNLVIATPAPPVMCGDANCDGVVNNGDIDAFVMALTDPVNYATTYGCTDNCDTNHDTTVNNGDIDSFVAAVIGGGCP